MAITEEQWTKYEEELNKFIQFSARVMALTGNLSSGSRVFDDLIKYILKWGPPYRLPPEASGGPEPERRVSVQGVGTDLASRHFPKLEEVDVSDLGLDLNKPEDLAQFLLNALAAGTRMDLDNLPTGLKQIDLKDLIRDFVNKKVLGTTTAPTRAAPGDSKEAAVDQRADALFQGIFEKGPEAHFAKLKNRFLPILRSTFKSKGPDLIKTLKQNFDTRVFEILNNPAAFEDTTRVENSIKASLKKELASSSLPDDYQKLISENLKVINPPNKNVVIQFNITRMKEASRIDESFLAMFGGWVKYILKAMFGDINIPVNVTGNRREVEAFAKTLAGEKNYIDAVTRYGLNNKNTYNSKYALDKAIHGFEGETGLKWPFA